MNKAIVTIALIVVLASTSFLSLTPTTAAHDSNRDGWALVDCSKVKAYPVLREYVWEKNASMEPHGPYDKIGLHMLANTMRPCKGAIFVIPGLWTSGEGLLSNPPTDTFTNTENTSECLYWANRGFDVYSVDLRRHFIPIEFNKSQLSFMEDWGLEMHMSDIKECVDKAKDVSGVSKLFMAGMSMGGTWVQFYAARYGQQDLKGLILLDPAPARATINKNENLTNSFNVTAQVEKMMTYGNWSWENPQTSFTPSLFNPGYIFLVQFAVENPSAPAQYPNGTLITTINPRTNRTWANITEWFEYGANSGNGYNTYGGMSDITVVLNMQAKGERYMPVRAFLDSAAMADWNMTPYSPYDYYANVKTVNVPIIAFRSGLNLAAYGNITNGMATTDFTYTILSNYGHGDVFFGTNTAKDVAQPTYEWMLSHRMLEGWGNLVLDETRRQGHMTVFMNKTTIQVVVDGMQASWSIAARNVEHAVRMYTGEGELGRIGVYIWKEYAMIRGQAVYFVGRVV